MEHTRINTISSQVTMCVLEYVWSSEPNEVISLSKMFTWKMMYYMSSSSSQMEANLSVSNWQWPIHTQAHVHTVRSKWRKDLLSIKNIVQLNTLNVLWKHFTAFSYCHLVHILYLNKGWQLVKACGWVRFQCCYMHAAVNWYTNIQTIQTKE